MDKIIKRTHTCGELSIKDLDKKVSLNGWISKRRDLGGLIFFDLRDRYGITQIVFDEKKNNSSFNIAKKLGFEDVIGISGIVIARPQEAINKNIITGEIDIQVNNIIVYNESEPPPFDINDRNSASEEHRLKYRYLELRTKELQLYMMTRHKSCLEIRKFLSNLNFIEIETPVLMKSTPEGARDFLVPSRIHSGKFYALPQSPQTYKQLLMVSGFDKYFQIVKCFRDEDFRADRQPEFTQIDIEMSFVEQEDIIELGTNLTRKIWQEIISVDLPEVFPQLTYKESMEKYGTDKPDLRFDMPLLEFEEYIKDSGFDTFKTIISSQGRVKAIKCPNASTYSRKVIDELTDWLKTYYNAKGLAWMKYTNDMLDGGISKFFAESLKLKMIEELSITNDEIIFIIGDDQDIVLAALGALRLKLGDRENLIDKEKWAPLWVVDFPLVEWNKDYKRWDALHHPFTSPNLEDLELIDNQPEVVRSLGYDIVMNGYELGGGSIRIHDSKLQAKIFNLLGVSNQDANEKFGFLMNAFKYGAPPHGGMAFGLDRIIMLLTGSTQIRDVIAFPKTTSAMSLMDNSPSSVDQEQLNDLGLSLKDIK